MKHEDNHFYEVAPAAEPGIWRPYCAGCSYTSSTYVYPCRLDVDNDERPIPTQTLYTPEKTQDLLHQALYDMVRDGKALIAPQGKVIRPVVATVDEFRFYDEPRPVTDVELP